MLYGNYQFECRFENDAVLPHYKGSTFRGVFGRALKKVVCALKRLECGQCLLNQRCVYPLVFETHLALNPHEGARITSSPPPFVIEPPLTNETHFPKGSSFNFSLLLFGDVNNNIPYFIYAFDQVGRIGLGKKIDGRRGRFTLESVSANGQTVYGKFDQKLKTANAAENLNLSETSRNQKNSSLKVILKTPLRIKYENRLQADLPFHVLVRAMLRRISTLMSVYGEGEPAIDYPGLVKRAGKVQIAESGLRWFDWRRYSFRQDRDMLMGGIVGSVTYEGKMGEYLPLLDFCSRVHIGKQTTFGLGKIKAEKIS